MKKIQPIRHGEVILKPIDNLPKGARLIETTNKYIVAHSETGHHHILESIDKYEVYNLDGDTYIKIGTIGSLFHEKSGKNVHTTHKIQPAIYRISIKKSFDYYTGIMARVRD